MPRRDEDSDDRPIRRPARRREEDDDDDRPRRRRRYEDEDDDDSDRPQANTILYVIFGVTGFIVLVGLIAIVVFALPDSKEKPNEVVNNGGVNPVDGLAKGGARQGVGNEKNAEPPVPQNSLLVLTNLRKNEEDKDLLEFDYKSPTFRGDEYMTVVTVPGRSPLVAGVRGFIHEEGTLTVKPSGAVKFFPSGTTLYICKKTRYLGGSPPQPISNILTLE